MNNWYVEANCCTSGNCIKCIGKAPFGMPIRVVHIAGIDEKKAKKIASNWKSYQAVAKEAAA